MVIGTATLIYVNYINYIIKLAELRCTHLHHTLFLIRSYMRADIDRIFNRNQEYKVSQSEKRTKSLFVVRNKSSTNRFIHKINIEYTSLPLGVAPCTYVGLICYTSTDGPPGSQKTKLIKFHASNKQSIIKQF